MRAAIALALLTTLALAADLDEFKVKRQEVFAFADKPSVTRNGDRVTVRFASKGLCDATVAIEDAAGRIIRHLASGVLGEAAPPPFQKGSLAQAIVWDGKDDQGRYVDDKESLSVRVSLGLRPIFERTLFWVPKRRSSRYPPLMAAAPEGVYVYDGGTAIDQVRLYSHEGGYVRTVYPFPADRVREAKGLVWQAFPQDGSTLPLKTNFLQCTMLTSGTNAWNLQTWKPETKTFESVVGAGDNAHFGMYGSAAAAMAVRGGRMALAHVLLNRLGTDGSTAGLPLTGPKVALTTSGGDRYVGTAVPRSAALSPDGRWLYLTGFMFCRERHHTQDIVELLDWRHVPAVMRVDMEADATPQLFAGSLEVDGWGSDNAHFKVPAAVAADAKGRVYVADYLNDRIQVFAPDGQHLKTIAARRPAHLVLHPRTGEIYVFSWRVLNQFTLEQATSALARYGSFEDPRKLGECPLSVDTSFQTRWGTTGVEFIAELDAWADPPTVWLVQEWGASNVLSREHMKYTGIQLLALRGGRLEAKRDFASDVARADANPRVAEYHRQRLAVNPASGKLYVCEGDDSAVGKSFKEVFEIDPETGRSRRVQLPFDAEDLCFDLDGLAYLRTPTLVARYEPSATLGPGPANGWREVPWDYGERHEKVGFGWMSSTRTAPVISGLAMASDGNWHHGGMYVSPKGHLAVGCLYGVNMEMRTHSKYVYAGKKYVPRLYPGRLFGGRGGTTCVHVWDRHGRPVYEDAIPGLADVYGVGMDREDALYVMSAATRVLDVAGRGVLTRYYNDMAGTLMKFRPGKGRIITSSQETEVPLSEPSWPKRPPDVVSAMQGSAWVEGAEWLYGGVGYGGKNRGVGCACWNARFALDYFGRSFAPELDRYSVAVLDSGGNLILRLGRYGNVEDGKPLHAEGGPPSPRPIGGDEVALFHGAYLATDTDRRLFIADPGNARILSVRLDYHATERVALRDVRDEGR